MPDDDFEPDDFLHESQQEYLYEIIGFYDDSSTNENFDEHMHDLFWDVMYNDELTYEERLAEYEELAAYLYENYGLDFEDLWDWEDFREWYDSV
jgi:hypothetical protein